MSQQVNRLAEGGMIDRSKPLTFQFDGKTYTGYHGDTLASALLANGVKLVGRSFKYHRPRGIFSAGSEEPNALVQLREGARQEANTRATVVELYNGLVAQSQNRGSGLRSDPQRINDLFKSFLPAGFYYKTFMGPFRNTKLWMFVERFIRNAAGMGTATHLADPDTYDHMSRHCEVLIIGAGPSGLIAAKSAASCGARVILVDERPELGGQLLHENYKIDNEHALIWIEKTVKELEALENVFILKRTTAFGYYDDNYIACVERVSDHVAVPEGHKPRQRQWGIQAKQVILATGSHEQPIVFGNNDRPNIMLANAVRAYINKYAVLPGKKAVVFTTCDDAYRTAIDLYDVGAKVQAIVDTREEESSYASECQQRNIKILQAHAIVNAHGNADGVNTVEIKSLLNTDIITIECDLVAMSNGWAPAVQLFSQSGGQTQWDDERHLFIPGESKQAEQSIGAVKGSFSLKLALEEGVEAGSKAVKQIGYDVKEINMPVVEDNIETAYQPLWEAPDPDKGHPKKFVDHQDDVAASDVKLAHQEGYVSVEHLKRYTTLGMGTDQGKTSNLSGLAIMAASRNCLIPEAGHTRFRPPFTPVAIGALGGAEVGKHFMPIRRTPLHAWHEEKKCEWVDAGLWRRANYYPKENETKQDAFIRETKITRSSVGLCDVTTLGKIELQGPDTAEFLERIYINHWKKLPIGKARYGMMLREDGLAYDDGTTARLGENHYLMTTTTANAVKVMSNLEFYLQVIWPELRVQVTSVTEQWAVVAVAGPNSRKLLQKLVDIDISNEAFPFMAISVCTIAEVPKCRLVRVSFSGELAYEVNIPSDYAQYVCEKIYAAGEEFNIVPYGTEAMGNMRIEKGHVAGPEIDGRTTADDLGLGMMLSTKKEFIGKKLAYQETFTAPDRKKLVGFVPLDNKTVLKAGSQIITDVNAKPPVEMLGHISSTGYCVEKDHPIALGLIKGGLDEWQDKTVYMSYPLKNLTVPMKVVKPVFVDPEGERLRA